jgi:hydroxymethylpyrimidine/phosphomethylpyrimidine kinase
MNFNQVTVPALEYERSASFYRLLGLRQIVAAPPRYARFECENGATFSFHVGANAPGGGCVVYFETADLDQRVEALSNAGVPIVSGPRDERWLWREARLTDPAGNEICLYSAGENRRFPPWRLDGAASA